jgi:hypothetical protein
MSKEIQFFCYLLAVSLLSVTTTLYAGDRLLATGGISQMEGTGGGGLLPWALITGYGTDDQIGGSAFYTTAKTSDDFEIDSYGAAIGFYNRIEISLSQTKFGLGDTVPHTAIRLNTLGLKLRLFGDAIYDQDVWYPQVAAGIQIKQNEDFSFVPKAIGAESSSGVDLYVAATKLYLAGFYGKNILLSADVRATKANQFGILGFGGDKRDNYQLLPSISAAIMLKDNLLTGFEYRNKPDNIRVFEEEDAKDLFVTWFPHKNFSVTGAYVDLGNIADKDNQTAWYLSGQVNY